MAKQEASGETEQIAEQLRRLYDGPSWLGPSLKKLVSEIEEDQARQRPIAGAHTIWELVLHITAWLRIARERISATQAWDPTADEDWPEMTESWAAAVPLLAKEVAALSDAIQAFPEEQLDHIVPANEPQTYYVLFHGVIQHSAYHAGQIAMLRKVV